MSLLTDIPTPLPRDTAAYERILSEQFGFPALRGGQASVLTRLAHRDVLAVMPTGLGKSMCYVLPSLVAGRTVVISPLIALMQDQVESLRANGVAAGFINSSQTRAQKNQTFMDFRDGRLDLLYVAPESLARDRFVELLGRAGVNLLAIDEAHCVSEWGHDFRPDYLLLGSVRQRLGSPRTLALTATADPQVRDDIARRLGIEHAERVVTSVDRPNLKMAVETFSRAADREEWLLSYLMERPGQSGIVYARSRRKVEQLAEMLSSQGIPVSAYHAGLPPDVRAATQRRFTTGRVPVIIATNAFGMGVNKPDVRFVVHYDMPGRLEAYYQEAGRAGRDGEPAECTLLYHRRARQLPQLFIDEAHPSDREVRGTWQRFLDTYSFRGDVLPSTEDDLRERNGFAMALRALRESGLVDERSLRPVSTDPDAPINTAVIAQHRDYAEAKLEQMAQYAEGHACRKAAVLRYFGEQLAGDCGDCDVCASARRRPSGNGRTSDSSPPPAYFPDDLHRMLLEFRNQLADHRGIHPGRVLPDRSAEDLAIYRPKSRDELTLTWGIQRRRADWLGADLLSIIADWEKRNPDAPAPPVRPPRERRNGLAHHTDRPVDNALFSRLREWRSERANSESVPAFTVFWDRTLADLARVKPANMAQLSGVFGLGAAKMQKYGADLLKIINSA